MQAITPAQLRKIHVLAREKGLDNDMLHSVVFKLTAKESLKKLSIIEAVKLIDDLEGTKQTTAGMITEKQKNFIKGLAKDLGWVDASGEVDEKRLNKFINERFNILNIAWLTTKVASQVIEALKAMKNRAKTKNTANG